ncbi:hypothetical protein AMATHDRAFT_71273 [Amanita thiersii Skay4041]|uniref:Insecticide toxin TcdB middle/N-terminal domain-containing protein n=1 Tax=Amanita thiersii Skay4041 TaxID=703135 RepID=A0A2A9N6H7_9AGAR|nr:hypothetical protein AMATHDRAFT_71273 [Amanita thiersii Skay4041]
MSESAITLVGITNTGQKDLVFQSGIYSVGVQAGSAGTLNALTRPYEVSVKGDSTIIATIRFVDDKSIRVKPQTAVDGASFTCVAQVSQSNNIVAPIQIDQSIDSSGSLALNVPLQLPKCRFMPNLSLGYTSAATGHSVLGRGWNMLGIPYIERIPATLAQDGRRGIVQYNQYDCYALSGQRLIKISGNVNNWTEYRFEIGQCSRIFAYGDLANPTYWMQYLPDGTTRKFGDTQDSNVKALTGQDNPPTRVWAVSQFIDPFSNYVSFTYTDLVQPSDDPTGAYYLQTIAYGKNSKMSSISKEFRVTFDYEKRGDNLVRYFGGYKVEYNWRMKTATTAVYTTNGNTTDNILQYTFAYSEDPLTKLSCLNTIKLTDCVAGVTTNPLGFTWTGSAPQNVFDNPTQIAKIRGLDPTNIDQIIPLDVNGNGSNDIVISSNQDNILCLDVYLSDLKGNVSNEIAAGSGLTGLPFSSMIYPLDINGNGISDILHILANTDGTYSLTALLSTPDRRNPHTVAFSKQATVPFNPPVKGGNFQTGDFSGTGFVGLAYIYQDSSTKLIQVIQFTSDGKILTEMKPINVPGTDTWDFSKVQIVVGDLTGSGEDDLFLLYPDNNSWKLLWIQSIEGKLGYKSDLSGIAAKVIVGTARQVLPFNADGDAKTGLLFVLNNGGNLRFHLLRSTGTSLYDNGTADFGIPYAGNVTVNRVSSASTLDVVNVVTGDTGPTVNIIRFDSQTFYKIDNTTQPSVGNSGSLVRWADLRGIGRSDCVIATFDANKNLVLNSMRCAGTKYSGSRWQPLDCVSSYSQGLRYSSHIIYAPLTDSSIYQSDSQFVTSLVNAFAFSCGSAAPLTDGNRSAQNICHSRVHLVAFPRFIVYRHGMDTSGTMNEHRYQYTNALIDFKGRGWLGFQNITQRNLRPRIAVTTSYRQNFPFIGLVSMVERKKERNVSSSILQITRNDWEDSSALAKVYLPRLSVTTEHHFGNDGILYYFGTRFKYDSYGNSIQSTIETSHYSSLLIIKSDFQDPTTSAGPPASWVVGNKTSETVQKYKTTPVKQTQYDYYPGTTSCTQMRNWVKDGVWINTGYTYDSCGNTKSVIGPDKCQTFEYDPMVMSNVVKTRTYTSLNTFYDETADYKDSLNLALGSPSSTRNSSGLIHSFDYDLLGRRILTSQGTDVNQMIGVEKISYNALAANLVETHYVSNGLEGRQHQWYITATDLDGQGRTVCERETLPDDLSQFIYSDTRYDLVGQVVARSRPYLNLQKPAEIRYCYDDEFRLIRTVFPPAEAGGSSVTRSLNYCFKDDYALVRETIAVGTSSKFTTRRVVILPNIDTPNKPVKFCVVKQTNEIRETISTELDELCRPVSIQDPRGVRMTLSYDGLSRVTNKTTTSSPGSTIISDFSVKFDDASRITTVCNEVTKTTVVSNKDIVGRVVKKTSSEETLNLTYYNEHLSTVSSDIGPSYTYAYDTFGNLKSSTMAIGTDKYKTCFAYTKIGQLLNTTNPDGSSICRTFYSDGTTVKKLLLEDASNALQASASFSSFENPYSIPLTWTLGDGSNALTSQFQIANDGMPTCNTISKTGTKVFDQQWKYDALRNTTKYTSPTATASDYGYDLSDQLISVTKNGAVTNLSYDRSGNITEMDGGQFTNNQGWQLLSVQKGGTTLNFNYSTDGNRIGSKSGDTQKNLMTYDSQNRLIKLVDSEKNVSTTFVYDFAGRLAKAEATAADGTKQATVYVSDNYEVDTTTATSFGTTTKTTTYMTYNNRIASLSTSGTTQDVRYYFHDWLGSTVALFDSDGNQLTYYDYDAYGTATASTPANDTARYKYCGKQLFSGFYYFGARFYDPDTGRFLTLDKFPVDLDGISPASFNRYAFSLNDPINYMDWNGNKPVVPWWHWVVDIGMIVIGLAIFPWAPTFGMALASGGLSGLITDINAEISGQNDDWGWGAQVFLGTAFGAFGGAVGGAVGKFIQHRVGGFFGSVIGRAFGSTVIRQSVVNVSRVAWKWTSKVAADALLGGGLGALQQVLTNANDISRGKKGVGLFDDVGKSALWGAIGGVGLGTAGRGVRKLALARGWKKPSLNWDPARLENFRVKFSQSFSEPRLDILPPLASF